MNPHNTTGIMQQKNKSGNSYFYWFVSRNGNGKKSLVANYINITEMLCIFSIAFAFSSP